MLEIYGPRVHLFLWILCARDRIISAKDRLLSGQDRIICQDRIFCLDCVFCREFIYFQRPYILLFMTVCFTICFREAVDVPLSFQLKNGESQFFTCRVTYDIVENGQKVTRTQVTLSLFPKNHFLKNHQFFSNKSTLGISISRKW